MRAIKIKEFYSVDLCRDNPEWLFVFGDNMKGWGKAGQAVIRDEPNSFGIPTKRAPNMRDFFSDQEDEYWVVRNRIVKLVNLAEKGCVIVFPDAGLGTGLAKMPEKSPRLYEYMVGKIKEEFDIDI